jgi:hypothetical protein
MDGTGEQYEREFEEDQLQFDEEQYERDQYEMLNDYRAFD